MKSLVYYFVLLAFLTSAYGTDINWTVLTDKTKGHLGYCYTESEGVGAMEKYEVKRVENKCIQVECGEGGVITFTKCNVVTEDRLCAAIGGNLRYPFPTCCPRIMCT